MVTFPTDVLFSYKEHSLRSTVFVDKMTVAQLVILWAVFGARMENKDKWSHGDGVRRTKRPNFSGEAARNHENMSIISCDQLRFDLLTYEQRSGSH